EDWSTNSGHAGPERSAGPGSGTRAGAALWPGVYGKTSARKESAIRRQDGRRFSLQLTRRLRFRRRDLHRRGHEPLDLLADLAVAEDEGRLRAGQHLLEHFQLLQTSQLRVLRQQLG